LVRLLLCVFRQFKMPLACIALTFTHLHIPIIINDTTSQGMSRVLTLMPTSSPKLVGLLCFCMCILLMCYTLVLSPLIFGVGFRLSLASFWGCLMLVLCAFVCFIGSLEPSRTRSNKLFAYPLIKLFEIQWTS
jgi:hypothetical protein